MLEDSEAAGPLKLLMETLQKLKIYILIIYVQGYLSKEPVGLTTHFC